MLPANSAPNLVCRALAAALPHTLDGSLPCQPFPCFPLRQNRCRSLQPPLLVCDAALVSVPYAYPRPTQRGVAFLPSRRSLPPLPPLGQLTHDRDEAQQVGARHLAQKAAGVRLRWIVFFEDDVIGHWAAGCHWRQKLQSLFAGADTEHLMRGLGVGQTENM